MEKSGQEELTFMSSIASIISWTEKLTSERDADGDWLLGIFLLGLSGLHFPQKPSTLGTPPEDPHPKIIAFACLAIFIL